MTDEVSIIERCNRVLDFLHKQYKLCGEVPQIAETARRLELPYPDVRLAYIRLQAEGRIVIYSNGRNSFYEIAFSERRKLPVTPRIGTPFAELLRMYREMEL